VRKEAVVVFNNRNTTILKKEVRNYSIWISFFAFFNSISYVPGEICKVFIKKKAGDIKTHIYHPLHATQNHLNSITMQQLDYISQQ